MEILRRFFFIALLVGFFVAKVPTALAGITRPMDNRGLVAYWSMEDCRGSKATDSSGRGNTGTITNFALTGATSNWVSGGSAKRGSCALNFGGTDDYISTAIETNFDFDSTQPFTISAWVKPANAASSMTIVNKTTTDTAARGFSLIGSSGLLQMSISNNAQSAIHIRKRATAAWRANAWVHVMGVYTGSGAASGMTLYMDGSAISTTTTADALAGNTILNDVNLRIGLDADGTSAPLNGALDDVRIYNRALTTAEVASLYNSGASRVTGSTTRGLVGYWSMEDCRGSIATDSSGRGNTGTLTNFTLTGNTSNWVSGGSAKRGSCALKFDGTDDYVQITGLLGTPTDVTVAGWARKTADASEDEIISLGDHVTLRLQNANAIGAFYTGVTWAIITSGAVSTADWHHYVYTYDDVANAQRLYIDGVLAQSGSNATSIGWTGLGSNTFIGTHGNGSTAYRMFGSLDDVRVYNRALSAPEVAALYTAGATKLGVSTATLDNNTNLVSGLVGHWTFDGPTLTATTALDSSGNANTGTLTGTNGLPKPVAGRLGQGIQFDAVDDLVTIADNALLKPTIETVSAWVNPRVVTGSQVIVNNGNRNTSWSAYILKFGVCDGGGSSGKISFTVRSSNAAGNSTVTQTDTPVADTWTHVVGVNDGTTLSLYINGVLNNTGSGLSSYAPSGPIRIGSDADVANANQRYIFNGSLDDVRVYNRALSAAEITQLYNLGR